MLRAQAQRRCLKPNMERYESPLSYFLPLPHYFKVGRRQIKQSLWKSEEYPIQCLFENVLSPNETAIWREIKVMGWGQEAMADGDSV